MDLGLQLLDGASCRCCVQHLVLAEVIVEVVQIVHVLKIISTECFRASLRAGARTHAAHLGHALGQPFTPTSQRLAERRRRGSQASLQHRQCKADGAPAAVVLQRLCPIELVANILGHPAVQARLVVGLRARHRVGAALGEQRSALEGQQAFLHHATHQVGRVDLVDPVAKASFEAVAVEQLHEQLEVGVRAIVGSGGHQQKVPCHTRQQPTELVALRLADLAAGVRRRHLVGLVAYHEIPLGFGRLELYMQVGVSSQLVEPRYSQIVLGEPVPAVGSSKAVAGGDVERQPELAGELLLPLFNETSGAYDKTTSDVTACHQLADQQTSHDRLSGAGIVCQQKAQRLARQHRLVHRSDLMRQRFDQRSVHRQQRVEQVGQQDALGLRHQPEVGTVAVEAPRSPFLDDLKPRLVVAEEQLVVDCARCVLVDQLDGRRTCPSHPLDSDCLTARRDAAHGCALLEVLQTDHAPKA